MAERIDLTKGRRKKLMTRDGRRVIRWRVVDDGDTLLPIEAVVETDDGYETARYTYTGARWLNVESDDDLIVETAKDREVRTRDCMPDVMAAIECARRGYTHGIVAANKRGRIIENGEAQCIDTGHLRFAQSYGDE